MVSRWAAHRRRHRSQPAIGPALSSQHPGTADVNGRAGSSPRAGCVRGDRLTDRRGQWMRAEEGSDATRSILEQPLRVPLRKGPCDRHHPYRGGCGAHDPGCTRVAPSAAGRRCTAATTASLVCSVGSGPAAGWLAKGVGRDRWRAVPHRPVQRGERHSVPVPRCAVLGERQNTVLVIGGCVRGCRNLPLA